MQDPVVDMLAGVGGAAEATLQRLIAEDGVTAQVVACRFRVPPLTARLIGRPATEGMTAGYARLCLQYVEAVCLRRGTVGLSDFTATALADRATIALASRLTVMEDATGTPTRWCRNGSRSTSPTVAPPPAR